MANLTFDEFEKLCDEAGIGDENKEVMENNYRVGAAISDVIAEIERSIDEVGEGAIRPAANTDESLRRMELYLDTMFGGEETQDAAVRQAAVRMASEVIRFLADFCVTPTAPEVS